MPSNKMFHRPLQCAHEWVSRIVGQGDVAVDATAGNGYDSLFLANKVGPDGKVHVFDIQQQAIDSTCDRLRHAGVMDARVAAHLLSHSRMAEVVDGEPKAIMFNLGYLPGGDKAVISRTEETLAALEAACSILLAGGIITVVCYPGHEGGDEEAKQVEGYFAGLPRKEWTVSKLVALNLSHTSPFLVAAVKSA